MIEILNLKQFDEGYCKAVFNCKIVKWELEIRECKLFEKNGKRWISLPSKPYEKDGEKKYFPLVQFSPEAHKRLTDAIFLKLGEMMDLTASPKNEETDDLPF